MTEIISNLLGLLFHRSFVHTANVYRELQGLYREIGVQGFQIYGDCMYTRNPCNFEIPHSYFHCNICREYDFTGILHAKFARGGSNGVPAVGLILSLDAVKIFFKTD